MPDRCFGNGTAAHHAKGCRPGRPLCRWQRDGDAKYGVCTCGAHAFPHRRGSGLCGQAGREMMNEIVWGRGERGDDDSREGLEDGGSQPADADL
jgi:hypothetical protein